MKKIELVLKNKGNGRYYFSNKKTDSENEIFTNKQGGVDIVINFLSEERITKCHAVELIDEIVSLQTLPITKKSVDSQLTADITSLTLIYTVRTSINKFSVTETEKDLPKFSVCECGMHGEFIGTDFLSRQITNQEDCFEYLEGLFSSGRINKNERNKLTLEIETSGLQLNAPVDSSLN